MKTYSFADIFKSDFYSIFTADVSTERVIITLALALALGLIIFLFYRLCYKGVLYSKNFNISLVLMTMITASIILSISSNVVLSMGMVGALSIVRFRTAIKDPFDTVYIFWAISAGIITGAGMYVLAISVTLIIGATALLLSKISFSDCSFLMVVKYKNGTPAEPIIELITQQVKRIALKSSQSGEQETELILELRSRKDLSGLAEQVRACEGVSKASLISYNGDYTV